MRLNVANNSKLFQFIDSGAQIWAMFLQNIATETVVGLNLDFISLGTNKIRKTLAHIAGASVSKS